MSRITVMAALAVMLCGAAQAEQTPSSVSVLGLGDSANILNQNTTTTPKLLTSTNHNAVFFGPAGVSQGATSESTAKLGDGLSAGMFSSLSNAPGTTSANWSSGSANTLATTSMNSGLYARAPGALNMNLNGGLTPFSSANPSSSFGGRVSQDVGNGVSLSLIGGVTRDPANAAFITPRGGLYMNSGSDVSATVGGAMSVELGNGSSFSLGATATKGSTRCGVMTSALCR